MRISGLIFLVGLAYASLMGASNKASGAPGAPITIEVYSDFQCPGCKVLHEQTLPKVMKDYVAHGKVYLVHHEFPLPIHAYAREAARYACAAERIGKYEAVSNALFAKQEQWATSGKVDAAACSVLAPAEASKLRAAVNDPAISTEIAKDMQLGTSAGLRQTPTMIITRGLRQYPVAGPVDYELLRRLLDDLLSK